MAQNRDFCLPHLHSTSRYGGSFRQIAMPFGMEKPEWLGYPTMKKKLKICLFVLTESTNVTDRQTHTQRHRMTAYASLMHSTARQKQATDKRTKEMHHHRFCESDLNPLDSKGNYSATSNNTKLVHWQLMGGLLQLIQQGPWAPSPLLAVSPNL